MPHQTFRNLLGKSMVNIAKPSNEITKTAAEKVNSNINLNVVLILQLSEKSGRSFYLAKLSGFCTIKYMHYLFGLKIYIKAFYF